MLCVAIYYCCIGAKYLWCIAYRYKYEEEPTTFFFF